MKNHASPVVPDGMVDQLIVKHQVAFPESRLGVAKENRIVSDEELMRQIDTLLSHVWMVRTFIKHADETEEDDDLKDVQRTLYDYMLALGNPLRSGDAPAYLKQARKKLRKLKAATELYTEIQPEISNHTSFQMSALSLRTAVDQIVAILEKPTV